MHSSETIADVAAALSKAQGEFSKIEKNRTVKVRTRDGGQYEFSYATLDEIFDKTRKPLSTNGLAITQQLEPNDKGLSLDTRLLHSSGQWLGSVLPVFYHADPQKLGSEITYKRRYAIAALLGVAADEDDDANVSLGQASEPQRNDATTKRTAADSQRTPTGKTAEENSETESGQRTEGLSAPPTAHRPLTADSARNPADRTKPVDRELIEKRIARIEAAEEIVDFCEKLPSYAPVAENPCLWPVVATLLYDRLKHGRSNEAWPVESCDAAMDVLKSVWLAVAAGAIESFKRPEALLAWCVELREQAPPKQLEQWREIVRLVLARTVRQVEAEAWPQKMGDALGDEMRAHTAVYKPLLEAKEAPQPTTEKDSDDGESNGDENQTA